MSFPRYPKYKPSGVEWLGDVPEHWDVMALKRFSTLQRGHDLTDAERTEGAYPVVTSGGVSGTHGSFMARGPGVVTGRYGSTGRLFYIEDDFWPHNTSLYVSDFHDNVPRFVWYSLQTVDFASHSGKAAVPGIDRNDIHVLPAAVPPKDEQSAITSFLDRETAKIDGLVGEQRRLIELLKEKRQAVISHAVTKGLNPHAPLKPSGIEWLGDVPEHWETCLLKRAFSSVDYGISDSLEADGAIAILRMGNIQNGKVVMDDLKYIDSVDPALLLQRGDLLYNRTNSLDLIGKVGMFQGDSDSPVSFASYLVRLRTVEQSTPSYFAYLLNTEGILGLARTNAFVAIGQCNLNPTRYGHITIAIPPKEQQAAIAAYLDVETAKWDALTAEAQRGIELLQERRTALISAAVTGKIDVRGLAATEVL